MSAVNISEFLQRMADTHVPRDEAAEQLARFEIDIVSFQLSTPFRSRTVR